MKGKNLRQKFGKFAHRQKFVQLGQFGTNLANSFSTWSVTEWSNENLQNYFRLVGCYTCSEQNINQWLGLTASLLTGRAASSETL